MKESLIYARDWIQCEFESGLPFFRSIPDTCTRKLIDGFDAASEAEQKEVLNASIFFSQSFIELLSEPDGSKRVARPKIFDSIERQVYDDGLKYTSLKLLKQLVGALKSPREKGKAMAGGFYVDPLVVESISKLETAKAVEIRKALKISMKERFGLKPANLGGGEWQYVDPTGTKPTLSIDYGGSVGQQIRYGVLFPGLRVPISVERLFGFGTGDWDYIHQGNMEPSLELLNNAYDFLADLTSKVQKVEPFGMGDG